LVQRRRHRGQGLPRVPHPTPHPHSPTLLPPPLTLCHPHPHPPPPTPPPRSATPCCSRRSARWAHATSGGWWRWCATMRRALRSSTAYSTASWRCSACRSRVRSPWAGPATATGSATRAEAGLGAAAIARPLQHAFVFALGTQALRAVGWCGTGRLGAAQPMEVPCCAAGGPRTGWRARLPAERADGAWFASPCSCSASAAVFECGVPRTCGAAEALPLGALWPARCRWRTALVTRAASLTGGEAAAAAPVGTYSWKPSEHPSFFPGRQAAVLLGDKQVRACCRVGGRDAPRGRGATRRSGARRCSDTQQEPLLRCDCQYPPLLTPHAR
jgi:hypothetical protein